MILIDSNPQDAADLEVLAGKLEATGAYRVLRKLAPRPAIKPPPGVKVRQGLFVDTETTGLDPARDEIIELAMVPFTYGLDGQVFAVGEPFQQLREPSKPIPAEITAITGIDDAMVTGKRIDPDEVAHAAAPASLVVAHNAAFDRKFLERFCETFNTKPWACSMSEVDWAAEGYEGTKLAYLAGGAGFFYERHRATHDCMAAIELLARVHLRSGRTGLAQLLERARTPSYRIWAENSPFDLKDILKARGYRWNGEGTRAFERAASFRNFEKGLGFLMAWPALADAARMIEGRIDDVDVAPEQAELWAAKLRRRFPKAAHTLLRRAAAAAFRRRDFKTCDRLSAEAETIDP